MKMLLLQPIIPTTVPWYKTHKDAGACAHPQHVSGPNFQQSRLLQLQ